MKESEKVLERKLVQMVKANGGWCIKLLTNHITGLPDRICLFKGGIAKFVELKSEGDKPRKIQVLIHKKLSGIGFPVTIIDNTEKLKKFIEENNKA